MAVVAGAWLAVSLVSAVPFLFVRLSAMDALFEAMSGITTTGASVLVDFSAYGRAVFLWRSILHWIGGLGVIALFVVILPSLGIAGRQLFFAEASAAADEGIAPQVRRLAAACG
jgi:trk system potassium uptake protein TrkH